ncbi:hypothetical protein TNCV_3728511 [Trichonephila clavipes]|nr:hypothetical protein TNCV_3728511 [Trichonephila clavipes]
MWNPQKAGYLLRNILGSKVVKTNLKGDFHINYSVTNFLYSVCELSPFIANDEKNQFKNDLLRYTLKQNGRNTDGTPVDRSTTLELVIRKTH